jgi:hypothetical protein
VITLLADANIQGQVAFLTARMQREEWREFWDALALRLVTFADVGLNTADPDTVVWQRCQDQGLLLITDNRNNKGPDSLEATIRSHNTSRSLPVFTIGDTRRILLDASYAERVIDRLFRYLLEVETIRGTGRLFLP